MQTRYDFKDISINVTFQKLISKYRCDNDVKTQGVFIN